MGQSKESPPVLPGVGGVKARRQPEWTPPAPACPATHEPPLPTQHCPCLWHPPPGLGDSITPRAGCAPTFRLAPSLTVPTQGP